MGSKDESLPILTKDKNILTFWEDVKQDTLASQKANKAMFASILMMRVRVPGSNKGDQEYEVDTIYPEGYPHPIHGAMRKNEPIYKQYGEYIEAYKKNAGSQQALDGTPIEQWALVSRGQAMTLKHIGVHTVEALATLKDNDNAISAIGMGGRKLVQQAADWILSVNSNAAAMQAQEEARKTQEQLNELQGKFNELADAFEALDEGGKEKIKAHIAQKHKRNTKQAA